MEVVEMAATKTCGRCGQTKSLDAFHRRGGPEHGYRWQCKECQYVARGPRRTPMTPDERLRRLHERTMLRRYNITLDEYDALLAAQGGVCADCGVAPGVTRLHVDHDHACCPTSAKSCGCCIRGLVCFACNIRRG